MGWGIALRAGLLQAVLVAVVAVALGAALSREFFVDWGWAAGPGAWLACAAIVGRVLGLPLGPVLVGVAVAGLPSLVGVVLGQHWVGAPVGVLLFAAWCGRLGRGPRPSRAATTLTPRSSDA
jgi:hypothetical protein